MEWFSNLITNVDAIPHIVFIYALVIVIGVGLGKIKFGGISLGITFVLFAGIFVGHLYHQFLPEAPYAAPKELMHFIKEFGLILFVYCIGLQVGPSFFASFKKGGIRFNMMALSIISLNIVTMLCLYYLLFDTSDPKNLPMMVGVLCGAITNTPGLGAATEALNEVVKTQGDFMGGQSIASGYACAYPLGVVGIILSTILIRIFLKINLNDEEKKIQQEVDENPSSRPYRTSVVINNKNIVGKTLVEVRAFLSRDFVCSFGKRDGQVFSPSGATVLEEGDVYRLVCTEEDAEAIIAFLGSEDKTLEWDKMEKPLISRRVLLTQPDMNGKTFGQIHFNSIHGVNVTRITRAGMELFASRNLRLQIGDRLMVVGTEEAVDRVTKKLGNSIKRLDHPNVGAIFIGILLGMILGSFPVFIPNMPVPVKLGLAGGPLIVAILLSRFGYKLRLVSYTTTSANLLLREIGLILFLASVGIEAGATFWDTLSRGDGLTYVWTGFLITIIPLLIVGTVARLRYKVNYFTLMGLIAGSCTDPPALAFAQQQSSNNDAASVGYTTVYPFTMFLRIITAQLIILLLC